MATQTVTRIMTTTAPKATRNQAVPPMPQHLFPACPARPRLAGLPGSCGYSSPAQRVAAMKLTWWRCGAACILIPQARPRPSGREKPSTWPVRAPRPQINRFVQIDGG
jgi:hypothetical protein